MMHYLIPVIMIDTFADNSPSVASHNADDHLSKGRRPTSKTFSKGSSTLRVPFSGINVNTWCVDQVKCMVNWSVMVPVVTELKTVLGDARQNQPAVPMNMQNLWNFAKIIQWFSD